MLSQEAMDKVQSNYIKCCGVDNYKDYVYVRGNSSAAGNSTQITEYKVPKSCCLDGKYDGCKYDMVIDDNTNSTGFYQHVGVLFLISLTNFHRGRQLPFKERSFC